LSDEIVDAVDSEAVEVGSVVAESATDESVDWQDKFEGQRKVNRDLERKYREASDASAALQAKLDGREAEYAAEVEKRKSQTEATLRAELKAAAKGKLADPADASLFINLHDFEVSDSGDVDSDALTAAIDDLITRKPHLAASKSRRFEGDADAGQKDGLKGGQITSREELKRLTPDQVVEAEAAGRLDKLLGRG
jgi:hypothetical protein